MRARVDDGIGVAGDRHERLVDQSDNFVTAVAQSHRDPSFVVFGIGSAVRTLKNRTSSISSVVILVTARGEGGDDPAYDAGRSVVGHGSWRHHTYPESVMNDTRQGDTEHAVADRTALRDLVDAYALHVDRRDAEAVAALFTDDGRLVSRLNDAGAPIVRRGRQEIAAALVAGLDRYVATTHIVGGQVVTIDGDGATGDTVCLAHHVYENASGRRLLVMAVRYSDTYSRQPGGWGFAERQLRLDWRQDRAMEDRP